MSFKTIALALTAAAALMGCQTTTGGVAPTQSAPVVTQAVQTAALYPYNTIPYKTNRPQRWAYIYTPPPADIQAWRGRLAQVSDRTSFSVPQGPGIQCRSKDGWNGRWSEVTRTREGLEIGIKTCYVGTAGAYDVFAWVDKSSFVTKGLGFSTKSGVQIGDFQIWSIIDDPNGLPDGDYEVWQNEHEPDNCTNHSNGSRPNVDACQ